MSAVTEESTQAAPDELSAMPADEAILDDRIRIFRDRPIPELDVPGAQAFVAEDEINNTRQLFARITQEDLYPRSAVMRRLRTMRDAATMHPVEWGYVPWGANTVRRFATIFDTPAGRPLSDSSEAMPRPMTVDDLCRRIAVPAIRTLGMFAQRGMTHQAIRPDNIFISSNDAEMGRLGDCVSAPAGFGQPASVLPIDLMMADLESRGAGSIADDIYALGATMLVLAIGYDPTSRMDDEELLQAKLQQGSFLALLKGARAPQNLRDPLRGMLTDDLEDRWTIEDAERWIDGTLKTSPQAASLQKADRGFFFGGTEFRVPRLLAHAFGKNWPDAAEAIRSQAFDAWFRRGLAVMSLTEEIEAVLEEAADRAESPPAQTRMVSRICMLLDPVGPLRYKGRTTMASGLGPMLAIAMQRDDADTVKLVGDCILSDLPNEWMASQPKLEGHLDGRVYTRMKNSLMQGGPGFGVERCAYELEPDLPCMSEILGKRRVGEIQDLLPALEEIVETEGRLPGLIDRHLPAYVAAHMKANLDNMLADIASGTGESPTAKLGMLKILSLVQGAHGPKNLVHLSQWIAHEIRPLVLDIQNRALRDKVGEQLDKAAMSGNLAYLFQTLSNDKRKRLDEAGFAKAKESYSHAVEQIKHYQSLLYESSASMLGRRIASRLGAIASVGMIIIQVFS